jgi:hypothetical protein
MLNYKVQYYPGFHAFTRALGNISPMDKEEVPCAKFSLYYNLNNTSPLG